MSSLEKLETEIAKNTFPLCKAEFVKNTKDYNYSVVCYAGCTDKIREDTIYQAAKAVRDMHNEVLTFKQLAEGDKW